MKWLRTAGMALAGFLLLLGLTMLGRDARRAKRAEQREQNLLAEGTDKALNKAVKQNQKATELKKRAAEAASATRVKLDQIGAKDEDMASILADWNTDRLSG